MKSITHRKPAKLNNKAVAALEFALIAPVAMIFLAAASDYGLAMWSRSCLTNAVSQGAYYAFRTGTTVTQANIVALVQNGTSLPGITATATNPAACYCPSGTPAVLGTAINCTATCPDGTPPGNYIQITGYYTLSGYFSLGALSTKGLQISDSVIARLK